MIQALPEFFHMTVSSMRAAANGHPATVRPLGQARKGKHPTSWPIRDVTKPQLRPSTS